MINSLVQHDFLCALFGVVHFLHSAKRIGGFEFFGDAALFYQPGEGEFDLPLCLLLGIIEMLIEIVRGEKRGVDAAAVLFEVVEAHSAVLADWVIGLFGERQVGIHNSVSFNVNEFHNSSSVIQYFYIAILPYLSSKDECVEWLSSFALSQFATRLEVKKIFFRLRTNFAFSYRI